MITFQEAKKKIEDSLYEEEYISNSEELEHGWAFSITSKGYKSMNNVTSIQELTVIDKEDGVKTRLLIHFHQILAGISTNEIYEEMRKERLNKK
jgi:hypothetical protein